MVWPHHRNAHTHKEMWHLQICCICSVLSLFSIDHFLFFPCFLALTVCFIEHLILHLKFLFSDHDLIMLTWLGDFTYWYDNIYNDNIHCIIEIKNIKWVWNILISTVYHSYYIFHALKMWEYTVSLKSVSHHLRVLLNILKPMLKYTHICFPK